MIARRHPLPEFTPFSIEPRMVEVLEGLILEHKPKRVLELGCGVSTLVIAYALEQNGFGTVDSLENEEQYVLRARNQVTTHRLDAVANIYHAPIRNAITQWDGMAYPWYDINVLRGAPEFDFVFVDGPAGMLGHLARWPAYYVLKPWMTDDVRLLLDDGNRAAEQAMIEHWTNNDRRLHRIDLDTGRGAVLLERRPYAESEGTRTDRADADEVAAG